MRVLIVSFFFPPYASVGALRVGKTAKFLTQMGHDVRVVTAFPQNTARNDLPLEIEGDHVVYTRWLHPRALNVGSTTSTAGGPDTIGQRSPLSWITGPLRRITHAVMVPDMQIGWYPFAIRAARRLIATWRPDVVLASSGPPTGLLVAGGIGRRFGIPWVGEFRDLWAGNHVHGESRWRRWTAKTFERRVLRAVSGLVTVSEPLAETLRARYAVRVEVVTNGFDETDYLTDYVPSGDGLLHLVYTGTVYDRGQDPSPLYEALRQLGPEAKQVRVHYWSGSPGSVRAKAVRFGVDDLVQVHSEVSYLDALRIQRGADVLLHLLWNDRTQRGLFSAKLFEYFGARRPILAIGHCDNVAAELVRSRHAGAALQDPSEIAAAIRGWLGLKRAGGVPAIPTRAQDDLTRQSQVLRLDAFLRAIVDARAGS